MQLSAASVPHGLLGRVLARQYKLLMGFDNSAPCYVYCGVA